MNNNATSTLQNDAPQPKELNYSFFRKKGIERLEQLTGSNWNDFNAHDPGITTLEQLCYALWDLSYRNTHAIQDIVRGSSLFSVDDFINLSSFALKLKNASDRIAQYLKNQLEESTKDLLSNYIDGDAPSKTLQSALIEELNKVLEDVSIYDEERFDQIALRAETKKFLEQNPQGKDIVRLNRLLLEDAYPQEIAKTLIQQLQGGSTPGTYKPTEVLPTGPVTAVDLRKVLIDMPGVNNAWVDRLETFNLRFNASSSELSMTDSTASKSTLPGTTFIALQGLLKVLVEQSYDDLVTSKQVFTKLNSCRGLCQDFQTPRILLRQPVRILARIEVAEVEDNSELLAHIYNCIAEYMSPPVPFYSFEDMQTKGRRIDQAFEGPKLSHGFIDSDELLHLQRRKILYASDLIHQLTDLAGVVVVKRLAFESSSGDATSSNQWSLNVDDGSAASFQLPESTIDIQLERNDIPIVDSALQKKAIERFGLLRQQSISPNLNAGIESLLAPPESKEHNISAYPSILREFPAAYGVSEGVLPESAPPERKAMAKQFKAYLMFFDQLLANQFAQLGNADKLFSFADNSTTSYFSQVVAEYDKGLKMDELRHSDSDTHRKWLRENTENPPSDLNTLSGETRRNRFLDHLLARFGQQFHRSELLEDDSHLENDVSSLSRQISIKRSLLADYVRIGHDRGLAFNYLKDVGPDNLSGLERVLRHKFGLGLEQHAEQFLLVEHILLRPIESDKQQADQSVEPFLNNARSPDPYSLQLTLVFPECKRYQNQQLVEKIVHEEAPVHLRLHFLWLDQEKMQTFSTAYSNWLGKWRAYRKAEFHNELNPEDQNISLRNARNQLINLLNIGDAPTNLAVPDAESETAAT